MNIYKRCVGTSISYIAVRQVRSRGPEKKSLAWYLGFNQGMEAVQGAERSEG